MPRMPDRETYLVPARAAEASFTEKRSKFIGQIWPAASEEEALARLAEARKTHADATHNVYAYIIRHGAVRYSDDGEPSGTAGQPVLGVLQKKLVFNVLCVVTRYYGGVLLGAGGLVRAYAGAASQALDAAGIARMRLWRRVLGLRIVVAGLLTPYTAIRSDAADMVGFGFGLVERDGAADHEATKRRIMSDLAAALSPYTLESDVTLVLSHVGYEALLSNNN